MRFLLTLLAAGLLPAQEPDNLPKEWIDADTGHRVIRLSKEPGTASLYFHQNAYSADGKKLVVTNPHGIATINLATRAVERYGRPVRPNARPGTGDARPLGPSRLKRPLAALRKPLRIVPAAGLRN